MELGAIYNDVITAKEAETMPDMLSRVFDRLPVAGCAFNEKGVLIACNFAWARLFALDGLELKTEAKLRFSEFFPPACMESLRTNIQMALYQGDTRIELPCFNAKGEIIHLDITLTRETSTLVTGYAFDVTRYSNSLNTAINMERGLTSRQRQIHDANPIAGHFWDEEFNLLDCNNAALQLFGVSSVIEFRARFFELQPEIQPCGEYSKIKAKRHMLEAFENGISRFRFTHLNTTGEEIPIDATFVRIDGAKKMLAAFAQDLRPLLAIAEEVSATSKKLIKAKEMNRILLEAAPFAVGVWDDQNNLVSCNKKTMEMFGLKTPEEYGKRFMETIPEKQPCGTLSWKIGAEMFTKAFEEGFARFEVVRQHAVTHEPIPVETTLIRIRREKEALIASFMTDLRPVKEAMAREHEAVLRWKTILDTMPIGVNLYDENNVILGVNQTMLNQFGFADREEYMANWQKTFPEFQPDGQRTLERFGNTVGEIFSGKATSIMGQEWLLQTFQGEPVPMHISSVVVQEGGRPLLVTYTQDLRQLRAATERFREEQQFNNLLYENSPHGVSIWNSNFEIVSANRQLLNIFGERNLNDFLKNFYTLHGQYQPDGKHSHEYFYMYLRRAFEGETVRFEWVNLSLTGEPLPLEITFVRYKRGSEIFVAAYTVDLREIKATMARLRDADERAAVLIGALPIASALIGKDYQVVECNQAAVNLLAKTSDGPFRYESEDGEICFCNESCAQCWHYRRNSCTVRQCLIRNWRNTITGYIEKPEHVSELIKNQIEKTYEDGYSVFTSHRYTLSGEEIFVEITLMPVQYQGGQGVALYMRDLREARLREVAEEESRAKTRFLAQMSHEIRTPMNAVIGITEIQLQKASHPPETEDAFLRISHSSRLLLSIINDILDISKVEAGKMEIIPNPYEFFDMIVETIQLNMMHIGEKPIDLKIVIDENIPKVMEGDDLRIKQIMNNLLSNAFKYTSQGTVTLSITCEPIESFKSIRSEDIMLIIKIRDTGQGMTKAQLNDLFEIEYNRLNLHINRDIQGSGLGMTITYRLVNLMGGNINVDSEPDMGTAFTVRIPQKIHSKEILGEDAARLQNIEAVKNSLKRITKVEREIMSYGRILLVDDVESNIYVAKGLLMPYKLSVDAVLSGIEAVDKIKSGEVYDIIFMDHMMPEMDGIEATRRIREAGYNHPVVAMTANILAGQEQIFLTNGFDGFISKPVDVDKLDDCLKEFVKKRRQRQGRVSPTEDSQGEVTVSKPDTVEEVTAGLSQALTASFLRDAEKVKTVLEDILQSQNFDEENIKLYKINTHAMKSALANIGEHELSDIAYALEEAARASNLTKIKSETESFLQSLDKIVQKLTPEATPDTPDSDPQLLKEQLQSLQDACENYNKKAAKNVMATLNEQTWSNKTKDMLDQISASLLHSDFESAAEIARKALD
ncbi:MAG: PAS domain-containing protein [Defluviitaleaceae bacterium]|nr:PAS domain-containing protein [Defluviitaleaceae bacterium]